MQADGNLVLYNPSNPGSNENPIWDTKTWGKDNNAKLVMKDDGNLVLLGFSNPSKPLWSSNAAQPIMPGQNMGGVQQKI